MAPRQVLPQDGLAYKLFTNVNDYSGRSHWLRGLRRRSAAARLLRLWVRIPPAAWMSVCCGCCVLLGRGLCDEPITRPEESYRLCCVVARGLQTSWMKRLWPNGGCCEKKNLHYYSHSLQWLEDKVYCILLIIVLFDVILTVHRR